MRVYKSLTHLACFIHSFFAELSVSDAVVHSNSLLQARAHTPVTTSIVLNLRQIGINRSTFVSSQDAHNRSRSRSPRTPRGSLCWSFKSTNSSPTRLAFVALTLNCFVVCSRMILRHTSCAKIYSVAIQVHTIFTQYSLVQLIV